MDTLLGTILSGGLLAATCVGFAAIFRGVARMKMRIRGMPEIALAAADGKLTIIQDLVQGGSDVNVRGPTGETALMMAARNSHEHIVAWLLDKGARVDFVTDAGKS